MMDLALVQADQGTMALAGLTLEKYLSRLSEGGLTIDECWDLAESADAFGLVYLDESRPILRRMDMQLS